MIYQFPIEQINKKILEKFKLILKIHSYTYDNFLKFNIDPFAWNQFDLPVLAYRFPAISPFGILFHLFFLGRKQNLLYIQKIFSDKNINELLKIKVLENVDRTSLQSTIFLIPYKKYYFASDFILQLHDRSKNKKQKKYEHVYPVRLDSITLCEASIKKQVDSVLDLGCGCGFQSIIASNYNKRITGIDINPRAVNFSQFNAILNGVNNCQFILGDLYKPVSNEKYDLILANPPYEIAPNKTSLYKDGGKYGHKILQKIIKGASAHLKSSGFCQIITKIAEFSNENRSQMIKKWVDDHNLNVFFLELYRMNLYQSAAAICTDYLFYRDEVTNQQKYSQEITYILRFLEKIHLTNVSFGIITLIPDTKFTYIEQVFQSNNLQSVALSSKLQEIISKHFNYLVKYKYSSIIQKIFLLFLAIYKRVRRFSFLQIP